MSISAALVHYLKFAVVATAFVMLLEVTFRSDSNLNFRLKRWTKSFPFEIYMLERGGS